MSISGAPPFWSRYSRREDAHLGVGARGGMGEGGAECIVRPPLRASSRRRSRDQEGGGPQN